jgi:hypothetical protein
VPNKSELYLQPAFTQQTVVNMSSVSVPAIAAEDPDILARSQSLKALGIGAAASCLKFAKALEEQGVLSLERLKKLPVDKAQKVLEKVQMSNRNNNGSHCLSSCFCHCFGLPKGVPWLECATQSTLRPNSHVWLGCRGGAHRG